MAEGRDEDMRPSTRQQGGASTSQPTFEPGQKATCLASFDGQQHMVEIIDRRVERGELIYYVHYTDRDRRLDEWVTADRLAVWALTPRPSLARIDTLPTVSLGGELLSPTGDVNNLKVTRRLKRKYEEAHHLPVDEHGGDHGHDKEHHPPRVKNIQVVEFGRYEMDTWYYSPYPEPYASANKLYLCEYTLKYFRKKKTLLRHLAKLDIRHPPGDEIYRSPPPPPGQPNYIGGAVTKPPISVFEVDGKKAKVYCQNLCLLSKLFLDHKTLYYDVDPFLFYVMCERDQHGYHMVGYFSKEKSCMEDYNLACILTLPAYQRKGYGKFLIAFAYELSRREGRVGTPERPLSDLGTVSFRSYWTRVLLEQLRNVKGDVSIKEMSDATMIRAQDIVETLQSLGLIKYWKGTHLIHADPRVVQEHWAKYAHQRVIEVDPACLHWQPLPTPTARKRP
ncbi:hypothetical protein VOLCADRAFT_73914 [Volvox carteri f. nagariensis]|uniref:Histone acetyltransferase n=1 Tax=Volvox carteri f. nagariensis TaxID=3068 RepID=D8TQT1_VOLCA|nr:uncharacterized protein VOLCADRAFT_73914 [Volvox carteri f. nagariensis]EFJ50209.1 hypothetical protein VOLCADRAFT_73914 [Volvox carteri f. nagariensis]|eukprot:XP_002948829.1 hypothetical protein VOLCADRAFT_73914 [Volvox carteri f. nagariensis]